tara:strand:+ start:5137 stop:5376 length:240 start_codon:yes stop_codon:yes gene_type:complete
MSDKIKDNVVKFPDIKDKVLEVKFIAPAVLKMTKTVDNDIALEIKEGIGQAWVPAKNIAEARKKLQKLLNNVTEFIDGV